MKLPKFKKSFQRAILCILLPAFATVGGPIYANPAGPSGLDIDAGNVVVTGLGTATVDINNFSQHAIVNWESFSIQKDEMARFNQGANAAILNRVITNNPTEIYGRLEASQGSVFLLNPNGILVGAGGIVDVAGMMTMSTLDVDDADFRNGGDMRFSGSTNTGVTNFGTISSAGGDVVLMGGFVDNKSGGQIGALNGTVAIGSGGEILLHEGAGTKISVRGASDYQGTGIENQGEVRGASVEMKAHGNVYALAINNGSAVRATGANRSGGRVRLTASGVSSNINLGQNSTLMARSGSDGGEVEVTSVGGTVAVAGSVDARGAGVGGSVSIAGNSVTQSVDSVVNASGAAGGSIKVDAQETVALAGALQAEGVHGAGGQVTVTANRIVINDGADLSADGETLGGRIRVGGDFQGINTGLREADSVRVEAGASLSADSMSGDAGTLIVWSNHDTIFEGDASATSRGSVGNGGTIEVSGKQYLYFDGSASVHAVSGKVGTVLFDPGDVVVGAAPGIPIASPTIGSNPTSLVSIQSINESLQSGANVLIITDDGSIFFDSVGGGGQSDGDGSVGQSSLANNRHSAIQWTNSLSSFGAFASERIVVDNHIRTSGAGSINLLGGWTGSEGDFNSSGIHLPTGLDLSAPGSIEGIWDHYVESGRFGSVNGSVFVGSSGMARNVEVGSRFGDTNVAGYDVFVSGSSSGTGLRYAQIGFHDGGQVFAPRLNRGSGVALDLTKADNTWYLSDGRNSAGQTIVSGVGDPIAGVAGRFEVDIDGDGIVDGVLGINSSGELDDTFIPYASHYNSVSSGNWWWQRIEADAAIDARSGLALAGSQEVQDPLGLGGLRPEYGAGIGSLSTATMTALAAGGFSAPEINGVPVTGADINVIAKRNVFVLAGAAGEGTSAMIGHGGFNRFATNGAGISFRSTGNEDVTNAAFSNAEVTNNTVESRWSINGSTSDRTSTAIARLAPVYGNINVIAGIDSTRPVSIDHDLGTVTASVLNLGNVSLAASQTFAGDQAAHSAAQIGHGGFGQFGEYYGDIQVLAGGSINVLAGEGNRSAATIGHTFTGNAYWNPSSVVDQQIRFFATTGDFDNTNLRLGELFSGVNTTGFDPSIDPSRTFRVTLGDGFADATNADIPVGGSLPTSWTFVGNTNGGNFRPERLNGVLTGRWVNVNPTTETYAARVDPANNVPVSLQVIYMNPAQYSLGTSGPGVHSGGGVNSQGRQSLAPLTLSRVGPVEVEALDGSVASGFHGDITVLAQAGNIRLEAFMTPLGIAGSNARERRFAAIGHGGTNFQVITQGSGYISVLNPPLPTTTSTDGRDIMDYRIGGLVGGNGDTTGSRSDYGAVGPSNNRSLVFMSISGDIDVRGGQNLDMIAGNEVFDYTRIGHGGAQLADFETSSFILGDINVDIGGYINVIGGGGVQPVNRGTTSLAPLNDLTSGANNYDVLAWSQIGHGGQQTGFMGFLGDINVEAGGNIHLQNGAFSFTYAKIGHQGVSDFGQSGGTFQRSEMFRADKVETDIVSSLTATSATVTYSANTDSPNQTRVGGLVGVRDLTASGAGTSVGASRNTSNISVQAGGTITLDHMDMGERQPDFRLAWIAAGQSPASTAALMKAAPQFNVTNQALGIRTRNSWAQIGHGGSATIAFGADNTATNYGDKVGNVSVTALGGNVLLENGEGEQRWTRIGHGVGRSERPADTVDVGYSRAVELAGDITVTASGNIRLDASAAPDNEIAKFGNNNTEFGSTPSRFNPVVIGHGGISDNIDVVVLSRNEDVNGIAASSDIKILANGNMEVIAGNGVEASHAQVGHGYASDLGNDRSLRRGLPTGFAGDIDVRVLGSILVQGGTNAWTEVPSSVTGLGQSVHGAFAAIGHGGYQLDAPSFGNITVYAGNNLNVIAQVRTDESTALPGDGYSIQNLAVGSMALASAFNFAKIGHFAVENGGRSSSGSPAVADFGDAVDTASQTGDIVVVVGNDLNLRGGTINSVYIPDDDAPAQSPNGPTFGIADTHTIYGAFAQIGHGGPAAGGDLTGNITVLVNGNISVEEGVDFGVPGVDSIPGAPDQMNNYAMIGNGDFLDRPVGVAASLFRRHAQGFRVGDIVVAAGANAWFDGALIGHADPLYGDFMQLTLGNTSVAASRRSPFYGGTGTLRAINGTVFSSGGFGTTGELKFFAPSRENNDMDSSTRVNERTVQFVEAPINFAADNDPDGSGAPFNPANEELAGRNDEVYLTPDLWWDNLGVAASIGIPGGAAFPASATSGLQLGSIAIVDAPGGFPNLTALVSGALGTSATIYRDGNGVSGAGYYTLYYDAIEDVSTTPPLPPIPPFSGTIPGDYDNYERDESILADGYAGGSDSLYGNLGLFEADESTQEKSGVSKLENRFDNAFGPRRDSTSEEEEDEERMRRKRRSAEKVGPIGLTYYVFDPATNRLSSYRVFGSPSATLNPAN